MNFWTLAIVVLVWDLTVTITDGSISQTHGIAGRLNLIRFENSDGRTNEGKCCDGDDQPHCEPTCDTFFEICLDNFSGSNEVSASHCPILHTETGLQRNVLRFNFGPRIQHTRNPIELHLTTWDPANFGIKFKVRVWDFDSIKEKELIDQLSRNVAVTIGTSQATATTYSITLENRANLHLNLTLWCEDGWYGPACQTRCRQENSEESTHYTCDEDGNIICLPGYTGSTCRTPLAGSACLSSPCAHGATCEDDTSLGLQCHCSLGYTGTFCEKETHLSCKSAPCHGNYSVCVDQDDGYRCECSPGWSGPHCNVSAPCYMVTCHNEGVCVEEPVAPGSLEHKPRCSCQLGFRGEHCEVNIDDCASDPCQHGGTCIDQVARYKCSCSETGYTGRVCDEDIDECVNMNPCHPEGTIKCSNTEGSFRCNCKEGFADPLCSTNMTDACPTCMHGGICVYGTFKDHNGSTLQCDCPSGYTGVRCESSTTDDKCLHVHCGPHGQCRVGSSRTRCVCDPGWMTLSGMECDTTYVPCGPSYCLNEGTCAVEPDDVMCTCPEFFTGDKCETDLRQDPCSSLTCLNGGTCLTSATGNGSSFDQLQDGRSASSASSVTASCSCLEQFTGLFCETHIPSATTGLHTVTVRSGSTSTQTLSPTMSQSGSDSRSETHNRTTRLTHDWTEITQNSTLSMMSSSPTLPPKKSTTSIEPLSTKAGSAQQNESRPGQSELFPDIFHDDFYAVESNDEASGILFYGQLNDSLSDAVTERLAAFIAHCLRDDINSIEVLHQIKFCKKHKSSIITAYIFDVFHKKKRVSASIVRDVVHRNINPRTLDEMFNVGVTVYRGKECLPITKTDWQLSAVKSDEDESPHLKIVYLIFSLVTCTIFVVLLFFISCKISKKRRWWYARAIYRTRIDSVDVDILAIHPSVMPSDECTSLPDVSDCHYYGGVGTCSLGVQINLYSDITHGEQLYDRIQENKWSK